MQSPVGTITRIESATAIVEVEREAACKRCAEGRGCGAGLLSGTKRNAVLRIALPQSSELQEGDRVILTLESRYLLRATALAYGLPLAGLTLVLGTAQWIAGPLSDLPSVVLAAAGLLAGYLLSRWQLRQQACLRHFVPLIEGRASAETNVA